MRGKIKKDERTHGEASEIAGYAFGLVNKKMGEREDRKERKSTTATRARV